MLKPFYTVNSINFSFHSNFIALLSRDKYTELFDAETYEQYVNIRCLTNRSPPTALVTGNGDFRKTILSNFNIYVQFRLLIRWAAIVLFSLYGNFKIFVPSILNYGASIQGKKNHHRRSRTTVESD